MLLNPCPLDAHRFTTKWGAKVIFADASDLGFRAGQVPGGRLYDDACDEGITVINHRNGMHTHWFRSDDIVIGDEVQGWTYKISPETVAKVPHMKGWEVHILND